MRCWYPEPPFSTLTLRRVFFVSVLNLWIPRAAVSVASPTVLIPAMPDKASDLLLNILTVVGLTTLTKYGSPSDKVPVIVFKLSVPIPIDGFPSFL